MGVYWTLGR